MEKIGLYKKIHNVMKAVEYMQKDDRIKFGSTDYKVITEKKVITEFRKHLIEQGLIILTSNIVFTYTLEKQLTQGNIQYKIIDIETGEHEFICSCGQGVDSQDKGAGKAMTNAFKYLLLKTFVIPTGDDPDKIASAEIDDNVIKLTKEDLKSRIRNNKEIFKDKSGKDKSESAINAVEECKTSEELKEVEKKIEKVLS